MNLIKWNFQNPKEIKELIQNEGLQDSSQFIQTSCLLRKINVSMIYYLLTECEGYDVQFDKCCFTQFQYIKTIAIV